MGIIGAVGLLIGYFIYKENKEEINDHVKKTINRKESKEVEKATSDGYYASTQHDKNLDNYIRNIVVDNGDKVQTALYLQNQEILSLLREMRDNGVKTKYTPFTTVNANAASNDLNNHYDWEPYISPENQTTNVKDDIKDYINDIFNKKSQ